MYWLGGPHCVFQRFWCQSRRQQDLMLLVVWGDKKFLVCVLWGNNSHKQSILLVLCKQSGLFVGYRRCMLCIQIRHDHFGWEVWDNIIPWCLQGWPTQGSNHICSYFFCWRGWWDKSLISKFKWNKHHLCKWHCWEIAWLWWDQQLVCRLMIWAVNRYVQRYRLTDRPLASTPFWAAPWIQLRCASHYSIIKIIRQLDNSNSIWL